MSSENDDMPGSDEPGAEGEVVESVAGEGDRVRALTEERDKLKDALLRALADADNQRKRAIRDRDEGVRKAREDMLRELLPVFDNLERASQYVDSGADAKAIGKGVEMVLRLFEDTLTRLGGKRLKSVGTAFDPQQHEAISQVESAEFPNGTVSAEAMPGYLFNDRLLRAAMVIVSKGPGPQSGSGEGSS